MTLPLPSYLQYALIKFIAHVNAEVNNMYLYYIYIYIYIYIYMNIHIQRKSSAFWIGE